MSEQNGHIELQRSVDSIVIGIRHRDDLNIRERAKRRQMPLPSHAAASNHAHSHRFAVRCHIKLDQFLPVRS